MPFSKLPMFVAAVLKDICRMDMRGYFACGYGVANAFDDSRGWTEVIDVTCRVGQSFEAEDLVDGDIDLASNRNDEGEHDEE